MNLLTGMVPVLPTPYDYNEGIDAASLCNTVDFAIKHGAAAVCLPAYGGEFYKLSEDERVDVVRIVVNHAAGRVPVIGQANHVSRKVAIDLALKMRACGADLISMAVPRIFGLKEDDLIRHFVPIVQAVELPMLLQDFNPGGATVGASFAKRLHVECPNFRYLKLEEPMMGPKVQAIIEATDGAVGVLEGWGGMYMLELIPSGICGVMPGLTTFPVLNRAFRLARDGQEQAAYETFIKILPFIVFQLQHLELYLNMEKLLLHRMGVIATPVVREAALTVDAKTNAYGAFLIDRVIELIQ